MRRGLAPTGPRDPSRAPERVGSRRPRHSGARPINARGRGDRAAARARWTPEVRGETAHLARRGGAAGAKRSRGAAEECESSPRPTRPPPGRAGRGGCQWRARVPERGPRKGCGARRGGGTSSSRDSGTGALGRSDRRDPGGAQRPSTRRGPSCPARGAPREPRPGSGERTGDPGGAHGALPGPAMNPVVQAVLREAEEAKRGEGGRGAKFRNPLARRGAVHATKSFQAVLRQVRDYVTGGPRGGPRGGPVAAPSAPHERAVPSPAMSARPGARPGHAPPPPPRR